MIDAHTLTRRLGGRWNGRSGMASCPAHQDRTPSLAIAEGEDGKLLLHCFAGCEFDAVIEALDQEGIDPSDASVSYRSEHPKLEVDTKAIARSIWQASSPIKGTVAEQYLRRRGIDIDPLPGSLRFNPSLRHSGSRLSFPALVAASETAGGTTGIQRTFLTGSAQKAPVSPQRMSLGSLDGGCQLSSGAGPLVIAEGLEDALSLLQQLRSHDPTAVATFGTSGMGRFEPSGPPGDAIIGHDNDPAGRLASEALAQKLETRGWRVQLLTPPTPFKDFNDALMAQTTKGY